MGWRRGTDRDRETRGRGTGKEYKKKKTAEAQRHGEPESRKAGEEQINHEFHEWANVTNYSYHL
jgi:hypothetical protein